MNFHRAWLRTGIRIMKRMVARRDVNQTLAIRTESIQTREDVMAERAPTMYKNSSIKQDFRWIHCGHSINMNETIQNSTYILDVLYSLIFGGRIHRPKHVLLIAEIYNIAPGIALIRCHRNSQRAVPPEIFTHPTRFGGGEDASLSSRLRLNNNVLCMNIKSQWCGALAIDYGWDTHRVAHAGIRRGMT